jgi:hypothetical protein
VEINFSFASIDIVKDAGALRLGKIASDVAVHMKDWQMVLLMKMVSAK